MDMTRIGLRTFRMISYVAVAGIAFQIVHFVEHVAQAGYWVSHPDVAPWLTPWAAVGRDALAADAGTGTEWLHLIGNGIFFVALFALCVLTACKALSLRSISGLKLAMLIQGFHVVEHIALTATLVWTGTAVGVSTFFGLVDAGPLLWSYRVWFHFAINLFATIYAWKAIRDLYAKDGLVPNLATTATTG